MTWNWMTQLEKLRKEGRPFVCVTVTHCTGSTPREPGAKMFVLSEERFFGTVGGGHLEKLALADAMEILNKGVSQTIRYPLGPKTGQCCGGIVDLFFEVIHTGPKLYLFGAGHVGQAICRTLQGTPFTVHLIDEREEWIHAPELSEEVIRHAQPWDEFLSEELAWDSRKVAQRTYVAIMTFRHDDDFMILEAILKKNWPVRYLGLIGSKGKWARFEQRLLARSHTPESLTRVTCPIGISLGGKAPQEIAISFAAELLRIHYGQ